MDLNLSCLDRYLRPGYCDGYYTTVVGSYTSVGLVFMNAWIMFKDGSHNKELQPVGASHGFLGFRFETMIVMHWMSPLNTNYIG